jgi:hypothetical protein
VKFLRSKKPKTTARDVSLGGSKAPVVRYYRPSQQRYDETRQNRAGDRGDKEARSGNDYVSVFWHTVFRWGGFALILFLFFANLTLAKPVVGISSDNKGSFRSLEQYSAGAQELFDEKLQNRSKLTVSSSEIEAAMKQKFPEIAHATVVIPLAGRELQVLLELSEPFARLQLAGNKQAVLSMDGRVLDIDEAQKAAQSAFSDLINISMTAVSAEAGQQIITTDEMKLMNLLQLEFDGSAPERPKLASIEYDVQKREMRARFDATRFYAKLTPEREARVQAGSLVATIRSMLAQNKPVTDYIDVRVEERVFVK